MSLTHCLVALLVSFVVGISNTFAQAGTPPLLAKPTAASSTPSEAANAVKPKTSKQPAASKQPVTAKKNSASKKAKRKKDTSRNSQKAADKKTEPPAFAGSIGADHPAFVVDMVATTHFAAAKASLFLTVNGKAIPYQRFFYNALPKQNLSFVLKNTNEPYEMTIDGQAIKGDHLNWSWQTPATPGIHELLLVEKLTKKTLTLNIIIMAPLKSNLDRIRGFMIGRYPPPKDGKSEYEAPKGLIEVNAQNARLYLSPHFQLGQFICKQKGGYPQYIAVQADLIEKLERLLERVNEKGIQLNTFEVMSGFRTPFYNQLIRNVKHSRHIYGSASDIFIDVHPRDGVMDDLNRDGKFDKKDAVVLYDIADEISRTYPQLAGGVGQYSGNGAHGPFVHVDVRGTEVRWGM